MSNLRTCTIQELREALGAGGYLREEIIKTLGFCVINEKPDQIAVVLREDEKDAKDLMDPPSYANKYNHISLVDRQALVAFAQQVLEQLAPSPELATLQRIETLLEQQQSSNTSSD